MRSAICMERLFMACCRSSCLCRMKEWPPGGKQDKGIKSILIPSAAHDALTSWAVFVFGFTY
jgi:hypothetical protein